MLEHRNVELGMEKIKAVIEFTNENLQGGSNEISCMRLKGRVLGLMPEK